MQDLACRNPQSCGTPSCIPSSLRRCARPAVGDSNNTHCPPVKEDDFAEVIIRNYHPWSSSLCISETAGHLRNAQSGESLHRTVLSTVRSRVLPLPQVTPSQEIGLTDSFLDAPTESCRHDPRRHSVLLACERGCRFDGREWRTSPFYQLGTHRPRA